MKIKAWVVWTFSILFILLLVFSVTAFVKLNAANTAKLPSIHESEYGLVFTKYNQLVRVIPPGRYKLQDEEDYVKIISIADRNIGYEDDTIRTADGTLYSLRIMLTYHRGYTKDDLFGLWKRYPIEAVQDESMDILVVCLLAVAVKLSAVSLTDEETFTERGMLLLVEKIKERLTPVMAARGCVLEDVGIQRMILNEVIN